VPRRIVRRGNRRHAENIDLRRALKTGMLLRRLLKPSGA
jgi:hypothetical protein